MHYLYTRDNQSYFHSEGDGCGVRMLALPNQLPAIRKMALSGSAVELCSVVDERLLEEPAAVPRKMSELPPASVSGWRALTSEEYAALALPYEIHYGVSRGSLNMETLFSWMEYHPYVLGGGVFPFEESLSLSTVSLLADIADVRRFGTLSKLRKHLQITTARWMREDNGDPSPSVLEVVACRRTQMAWVCPAYSLASPETVRRLPRAFLYRDLLDWSDRYSKEKMPVDYAAMSSTWRVTQRYVAFLYRVWLGRVLGQPLKARDFFRREDEVSEFESYVKELDSSVDSLLEVAKLPIGGET
jgi:hypothetical protein